MALQKTLINKHNGVASSYWVLAEYAHYLHCNQIKLVVNGYISKEIYEAHGVQGASDTRTYYLDTKKKLIQQERMATKHIDAVYQDEEDGTRTLISEAYDTQVGTGEYEEVWVNEKEYVNADALIGQVVPYIYRSLSEKGDFLGAGIDLTSQPENNEQTA